SIPVVVQLHGPIAMFAHRIGWPDRNSDLYRVGNFMEGFCIKRANGLMACSENIRQFTSNFYDIPIESIEIIHCGVDASRYTPDGPRITSGPKRPTVLFVGNIAFNKGLETVFEAVMRLRQTMPNILLRVAGKGDDAMAGDL